jgi:hypothetical protein
MTYRMESADQAPERKPIKNEDDMAGLLRAVDRGKRSSGKALCENPGLAGQLSSVVEDDPIG